MKKIHTNKKANSRDIVDTNDNGKMKEEYAELTVNSSIDNTVVISQLAQQEKEKIVRIVSELVTTKKINTALNLEKAELEKQLEESSNIIKRLESELVSKNNEIRLSKTLGSHGNSTNHSMLQQKTVMLTEKNQVYESQINGLKSTIRSLESDVMRFTDLISHQQETMKSLEISYQSEKKESSNAIQNLNNRITQYELQSKEYENDKLTIEKLNKIVITKEKELKLNSSIIDNLNSQINELQTSLKINQFQEKKFLKLQHEKSLMSFEFEEVKRELKEVTEKYNKTMQDSAVQTDLTYTDISNQALVNESISNNTNYSVVLSNNETVANRPFVPSDSGSNQYIISDETYENNSNPFPSSNSPSTNPAKPKSSLNYLAPTRSYAEKIQFTSKKISDSKLGNGWSKEKENRTNIVSNDPLYGLSVVMWPNPNDHPQISLVNQVRRHQSPPRINHDSPDNKIMSIYNSKMSPKRSKLESRLESPSQYDDSLFDLVREIETK
jgi:hypothetical protein